MTKDELRASVLGALGRVAPEADLERLTPDADIREELDIDSMDFLNYAVALHESLGVDVPERDYAKISTPNEITTIIILLRGTPARLVPSDSAHWCTPVFFAAQP